MAKLDFTTINSHPLGRLSEILAVARELKAANRRGERPKRLPGKVLILLFEKPSLRTRLSFEVAMTHLGGSAFYVRGEEVQLGKRESVEDAARVFSGYADAIVARTFEHDTIERLACHATIPVINGLSDDLHPCQAMADIMTIEETLGSLNERTVVFVGDGNNVARSLAVACAKFGLRFILATPAQYRFDAEFEAMLRKNCPSAQLEQISEPAVAVRDADVIYADTFTSMGQEGERARREQAFVTYQVNSELLVKCRKKAIVMHCLPAHRGVEITDEVMDGPQSVIFQQAENRLHFQKGLLAYLLDTA